MPKLLTDRELGQLFRLHAKRFKEREPYPMFDGSPSPYVVGDRDYHTDNAYEVSRLFELVETIR
jgi:hypothetical protein